MFTDAQILYLEEVLGASVDSFRASAPASHRVAVLTPPLTNDERLLLEKILASVQLNDYIQIESTAQIPESAVHVLCFQEASGRWVENGRTWWGMPALSSMIGTGAAVASAKKEAWALLQQFQKDK